MPQLQQLWEQYQSKGLHIFACESQGIDKAKLETWLRKRNATYPNTIGRGAFSAYEGKSGLPYAFVIGVDGKVIWEGRNGYKQVILEEIKKVRYPGLGKASVAKGLEKSASLYSKGAFAKAVAEAEKKLSKAEDDATLAADAKFIMDKVEATSKKLHARFDRLKGEREFSEALATLGKIAQGFKGTPVGDAAKTNLKALKKDKAVKKELQAEAALAGVMKRLETLHDPQKKAGMLEGFIKKFEGTKAAERAQARVNEL